MKEALDQDVAEARRRFDEACERLRPELHRFCTRMTGSPCDGEDVLQDALVLWFYRLSELRDGASLRAWLFRIAHNKCIDFLRVRRRFDPLDETFDAGRPAMDEELAHKERAAHALATLVTALPAKERACVILKDALDCPLDEIAEVTESNVGAVKAALHRGRERLQAIERAEPGHDRALDPRRRALYERYLAAFNGRDWDRVQALLTEDARLEVVHRTAGPFAEARYFVNYGRLAWPWRLSLAWVDGVEAIVHFREVEGAWIAQSVVQLSVEGDRIAVVRDYFHVDYLLRHCTVVPIEV